MVFLHFIFRPILFYFLYSIKSFEIIGKKKRKITVDVWVILFTMNSLFHPIGAYQSYIYLYPFYFIIN